MRTDLVDPVASTAIHYNFIYIADTEFAWFMEAENVRSYREKLMVHVYRQSKRVVRVPPFSTLVLYSRIYGRL